MFGIYMLAALGVAGVLFGGWAGAWVLVLSSGAIVVVAALLGWDRRRRERDD